jgi:choline-sulfatase
VVYDEYGPVRMVRTVRHKYVHRHPDGPHELYDLDADPGERVNLVGDAGHARTVAELRGLLRDWFARHTDPRRDGRRFPVTGKGQLGPTTFHALE